MKVTSVIAFAGGLLGFLVITAFGVHFGSHFPYSLAPHILDYSRPQIMQGVLWGEWYPAIEPISNAYYLWRENSLILGLGGWPALLQQLQCGLLFLAIFYFCLTFASSPSLIKRLSMAVACVVVSLALIAWLGIHSILLPLISSFVLLLAILRFLLRYQKRASMHATGVLILVAGLVWVLFSTNQIAPLIIACAWFFSTQLSSNAHHNSRIVSFILVAFLGVGLYVSLMVPGAPFPDYPSVSHVVPDDGLAGNIYPLIGAAYPLPVIHRAAEKSQLMMQSSWCAVLFILLVLIAVLRNSELSSSHERTWGGASILLVLVLLDCYLPEEFAHIAPLATLTRLVPGLFFFSLSPVWLAITMVTALLLAVSMRPLPTAFIVACGFFLFNPPKSSLPMQAGDIVKFVVSPSHSILREYGPHIIKEHPLISQLRRTKLTAGGVAVSTSSDATELSEEDSLRNILDKKNRHTRWSPHKGRQEGNEWIHLTFDTMVTARGIVVSAGQYATDFPRGLRISVREECPLMSGSGADTFQFSRDRAAYRVLRDFPSWQGALRFTVDGYPYYDGQNSVEVIFPSAITTRCLLIEQTGVSNHFDWSVSDLYLLQEPLP